MTVDVGTSITTVAVRVTAAADDVTVDVAALSMTTVGVGTSALGTGAFPIGCGVGVSVASGAIDSRVDSTALATDIAFTVAAAASSIEMSESSTLSTAGPPGGVQADATANNSSEASVSRRNFKMPTLYTASAL